MTCSVCEAPQTSGSYCVTCGGALKRALDPFCPDCGMAIADSSHACPQSGSRKSDSDTREDSREATAAGHAPIRSREHGVGPSSANSRRDAWKQGTVLDGGERPVYVAVARRLGSNWGMWLCLALATATFWLPWWHLADRDLGEDGISAVDNSAPAAYPAFLTVGAVAVICLYLALSDSRIHAFFFRVADAWVALVAVALLAPFAVTGLLRMPSGSWLSNLQPTHLSALTLALVLGAAVEAIRLIRSAPDTMPMLERGRWTWPSKSNGIGGPECIGGHAALRHTWRTPFLGAPSWVWAVGVALMLVLGLGVYRSVTSYDAGCVSDANDLYNGGSSKDSGVHTEWQDYVRECSDLVG